MTSCAPGQDGDPCGEPGGRPDGYCCGGQCLHRNDFDNQNCGGCGIRCSPDERCESAQCQPLPYQTCAAGGSGALCRLDGGGPGQCCGASCDLLDTDPANCGRCGKVCVAGSTCESGTCTLPDAGAADCVHLGCDGGSTCSASSRECVATTCEATSEGLPCSFGPTLDGTCCGGACVNTSGDPNNCTACGSACASGMCVRYLQCLPTFDALPSCADAGECGGITGLTACIDGRCLLPFCVDDALNYPCDLGSHRVGVCYGATCVDFLSDAANCGGLGLACPSGQACSGGVCSGAAAECGLGRQGAWCDGGTCCQGVCQPLDAGC